MSKTERKMLVLKVLEESGAAMKTSSIFRNCKLRGATFSENSTKNYLKELNEQGKILRVSHDALELGAVAEADDDERGMYMAMTAVNYFRGGASPSVAIGDGER